MGARYVVVGTARSATMYTAHLLTAAGLDCRHEHTVLDAGGTYGLPPALGESSCYVAPFLPQPVTVVHLVRPPLDAIGSLAGRGMLDGRLPEWERFTREHVPDVFTHPPGPQRAAAYWLAWNWLIEPHADVIWRTPSVTRDRVLELADRVGIPVDAARVDVALAHTSTRTNARDVPPVTLDDLGPLARPVTDQAAQYGIPLTHTPTPPSEADMPEQETFRNVRTGITWTVDAGSPEHKRMTGSADFETVPPDPPKPKRRTKKPEVTPEPAESVDDHPGGLDEFMPRGDGDDDL